VPNIVVIEKAIVVLEFLAGHVRYITKVWSIQKMTGFALGKRFFKSLNLMLTGALQRVRCS